MVGSGAPPTHTRPSRWTRRQLCSFHILGLMWLGWGIAAPQRSSEKGRLRGRGKLFLTRLGGLQGGAAGSGLRAT